MYYIYKITNLITEQNYIGVTQNYYNRMKDHKYNAQKGSHYRIHEAIREYGWDNFSKEIIYQSLDKQHTHHIMEPKFVKEYNAFHLDGGYNSTKGGAGAKDIIRQPLTEEQKLRIKEATILGMTQPEIREKISKGVKKWRETPGFIDPHLGKKRSQEAINNMVEGHKKTVYTTEWSENRSQKSKEIWDRPGMKEHLIAVHTNITEETRQKMSQSRLGKIPWNKGISPSPESVAKRKATIAQKSKAA